MLRFTISLSFIFIVLRLVYMLAIKGTFISKLWQFIIRHEASIIQSSTGQMACLQDVHMAISVFCDVFTFYTETLTDSESTDTSGTFTSLELGAMSELLKNVALNLIELAFPMCRSNSVRSLYFSSFFLNSPKINSFLYDQNFTLN